MKASQSTLSIPSWVKPLLFIAFAAAVAGACKEQSSSSSGGGMPSPPSGGGMPAPPGPPAPPGGGSSGGSSGGGGMPPPPMPGGGSQGGGSQDGGSQDGGSQDGGSQDGSSGPSGSSGGSGGEVGSFPGGGDESAGVPPPPGSSGGDGDMSGESGSSGDGDSEEPSEWEEEASPSDSECGDTGSLPGGVGGMGQDGECIGGGGASASESDSASESSGGGGGGADGSVQGTGGAGSVGQFPEETADERAERLGQELDESIEGFDGMLQEEQSEISAAGRNTEGFGEGTTGASGGGISLGEQASGAAGSISVANTSVSRESPTAGMSQEEIRARTPDDIPILVDDDIIARQLREAALVEEDPALRDRLWEEYRKYSGI